MPAIIELSVTPSLISAATRRLGVSSLFSFSSTCASGVSSVFSSVTNVG